MSHRTFRRGALAFAGLLALVATSFATLPAAAHEVDPISATTWANYERVTLTRNVGEPIDLAVLPDSRVLHTTRGGQVRLTDPATGTTTVVNTLDVYANSEDGLQTITLDPAFEENHWVYLYYAPRVMVAPYPATTPVGSAPSLLPAGADESYWAQWVGYNQLSRFQWDPEANALDLSTEQVIIRVEVQRGQCCHVAGDVAFDDGGNLYLATGDNTPATVPNANGYAPNNDRINGNPGHDSRRGAGNTNDLRGKILRITVQPDGSYTIPEGNLFAPGTADTRPEIFVMGVRNPFRISVDPATDSLLWADYGPDAGTANPDRGPMGYVEWQRTTAPLNSGWPYCHGPNANYNDYDWDTLTPGPWFDCNGTLLNTSRYNTGLDQLPSATAPQLYYGDQPTHQPWPQFGSGGQGPMGGPVYRFDHDNPSPTKFPEYWDGKAFLGEFSRDYVLAFSQDDPDGPVTAIEPFLPNAALNAAGMPPWDNVMDLEFGPDGSLYVLDYGDGFFRPNPDAGLFRVDYVEGTKGPSVQLEASPTSGHAPLEVEFDATGTTHPNGLALSYAWDFGDGTFTPGAETAVHTYTADGQYTARVRVTDSGGRVSLAAITVTVGNTAPTVAIRLPEDGTFTDWGDVVAFEVEVTDPEDATIDCSRVTWSYALGHDNTHAHPLFTGSGCTAQIATTAEADHGETENIYGLIGASYADGGSPTAPVLSGDDVVLLYPREMQVEHRDASSGTVTVVDDPSASGQRALTGLAEGEWVAFDPVSFTGVTGVELRAAGVGEVQLRWADPDADPFAEFPVDAAGWALVARPLVDIPADSGRLYLTATGAVDLDRLVFSTRLDDLDALLGVVGDEGAFAPGVETSLRVRFDRVVDDAASGDLVAAIAELEALAGKIDQRVHDQEARDLLLRAVDALVAEFEDQVAAG